MFKIAKQREYATSKKYYDGEWSFKHLRDANGQYKMKDVGAHLEKAASALRKVAAKFAEDTYNQFEHSVENRSVSPEYPKDSDYVNNVGTAASARTAPEVVQRNAPLFQQTVVNDGNQQADDNTVYPKEDINKKAAYGL